MEYREKGNRMNNRGKQIYLIPRRSTFLFFSFFIKEEGTRTAAVD